MESSLKVKSPISSIPSTGPSMAKKLKGIGVETIEDLLLHFPRRYLDFSVFNFIKDVHPGETVTVRGTIKSINTRFSFKTRMNLCEAIVSDKTGSIKVIWFNQGYLAKQLKVGDEVFLSGKADDYKGLQLVNPVHEKVSEDAIHTGRLVPVYKLPEGVYDRTFRTILKRALPLAKELPDIIPQEVKTEQHIVSFERAIQQLHFPENVEKLSAAKFRMAFSEALVQQLAVEQYKLLLAKKQAHSIPADIEFIKTFLNTLPFELTKGQKAALWQIVQDMEHEAPMNRLLQGDVGSGKTLVALVAALLAIKEGFQVAFLAPTEILAKQHFDGFTKQLQNFPKLQSKLVLHTRSHHFTVHEKMTKAAVLKVLQNNDPHFVIGTHALLQEAISFQNLAFVVIDEQHRFGVEQRARLLGTDGHTPHLLSMSATPIPRTLALTIYSDLTVSILNELPKARQTIETKIVTENNRSKAYQFIRDQISAGRQAFIVTPLVEESEKLQTKSAKAEFARLQKSVFPDLKLGLLYGTMKGNEKDAVMQSFAAKELDILVATSVIEIGIDVPNATVIVIEDADRFGLAQLHQLRGRVGRDSHKSFCFLFSTSQEERTMERLNFFASCTNGFKLAEIDLEQRGFGSLFGKEQTGFNFTYGKYMTLKTLKAAKDAAQHLTANHPDLKPFPLLKKQVDSLKDDIHLE